MTGERIERLIREQLEAAERAFGASAWNHVREACDRVLTMQDGRITG